MAESVADFIWNRLHDWSVHRVYGYPGDGIGGLIAALRRQEERIAFVQARGFAGALAAGDPAAGSVLAKTVRSVLSTLSPGKG